ncbi:tetratricopeptide repeat protein [Ktedonosporobacter rubrisoli]|uniref:non-specific serine/threonine protein kinase n=1 Tax=Ktedonosporobacter rubrisoli TaxID=2509675 RepID=A0A4P6JWF5_KTERU|nr:serine/threonine-protein kinase [Ktedonosporobacter rubrisoli]QBD79795.1 tetratricopeptide repeat protein [Ktedonosporobacter rubrisoli]
MATSTCPYCHQSVKAIDEICENCGIVLTSPIFISSQTTTPTSTQATCPHCREPIKASEEICENCGMVLQPAGALSTTDLPTAVMQEQCPRCQEPRRPNKKFCARCGYRFGEADVGSTQAQPVVQNRTAPLLGRVLNSRYKVNQTIGEGGMGSVYLAEDLILKRQVVIKALLSDDDPDLVAQSVKEREFLAAIKHSNIVSIYDFITENKRGYIVMEHVHGKTLEQIMEEQGKPFEAADAIRYILGILPAFSYLAKLQLVYCDFKPQNVMLEKLKDGTQIVKLIDLGTVIKYERRPRDVYGTHGFYALEAVRAPSPETDLYTICRTLAYLVSAMDLADPVFGMPPSEHYKAFRDYPALYRLLCKGTHTQPARRFHSAEDLADQLAGVLRQIEGGTASVPINSHLFVSSVLTTTGKLGLRGEAALDEKDKAIVPLRSGDQALRSGNLQRALELYQKALTVNSKSIDALARCAEVLVEQEDYINALTMITRLQQLVPGHWKVA